MTRQNGILSDKNEFVNHQDRHLDLPINDPVMLTTKFFHSKSTLSFMILVRKLMPSSSTPIFVGPKFEINSTSFSKDEKTQNRIFM